MLKYRGNGPYKALSIILAVAILLASPIGMSPAYSLEDEPSVVTGIQSELLLNTSEETHTSGVADSGTPPETPASLSETLASPVDAFPPGINPLEEVDMLPEFGEGYPKQYGTTHPGSKYVWMTIKPLTEPVTAYYIALQHGAANPSKEQVKARKDSGNNEAIKSGFQEGIRLNGYNLPIGPLPDSDTVYDFWVVLENASGILSAPKLVELSTPKRLLLDGYPKVGGMQPVGSKQVELLAYTLGSDNATGYYVAVADGATAPTYWQIKQGWDGSTSSIPGNPALVAGSVELTAQTLTPIIVSLPADATDYDVYMVVNKTYNGGGFIEDIWSGVVKLDVKTPASSKIIEASSPTGLETALGQAVDGDMIRLTESFTYTKSIDSKAAITIKGKNITLDMNGQDLTIHNPSESGMGLRLERPETNQQNASQLHMIGSGNLKIYAPSVGLSVDASKFTSTSTVNVEILGGAGAGIGGTIANVDIQNGSVTGHNGISVSYNSSITVKGHIKATGNDGIILSSSKMYDGDIGCVINVDSVEGVNCGIFMDGGEVTVDGTITASTYIQFKDAEPTTIDDYLPNTTLPGYRTYQHETAGTVWVKGEASSNKVCAIGTVQYATIADAVAAAPVGEITTITLLQTITHNKPVEINGKGITFALGDFDLTIDTSAVSNSTALRVLGDGKVSCTGSGKLHVVGSDKGIWSSGGSELHISGNVIARQYAVMAGSASSTGNPKITVDGDVTVTGQDVNTSDEVEAVSAGGYATVTIGGNVTANRADDMQSVTAVYSNASTITIGKNVTTQGSGVNAQNDGNVTIKGALHYNPTGSGDQPYIKVGVVSKTADDFEPNSIKLDYREYRNGDNVVWVKEAPAVCTIGAQKFTSLDAAIDSVPTNGRATITLLHSIKHTKHIRVEKKTINLDLMDYDILLDTSADGSSTPALTVTDGGKVNLIGNGTGKFNIESYKTAISVRGINSEATVHNVVTDEGNGVYMVGSGDNLDSSSTVTVLGNITVGNGNGVEVNARGGRVIVEGNIVAGRVGVDVWSNPSTYVTVKGDITVNGFVAIAGIRAYGETNVDVTGNVTVQGNNPESKCVGVHASGSKIKVGKNVMSSGTGVHCDNSGGVEITGSLTAGTPFITFGIVDMAPDQGTKMPEGYILYSYGYSKVQIGSIGDSTPTYTVTVENNGHGTGSASPTSAKTGTEIILTASPSSGYMFKEWQVISGGVTIKGNKFTMPPGNVTVKAIFEKILVQTYMVTVKDSYASTSGTGSYTKDATVNIYAGNRSNYTFTGWTSSDVTITNAGNKNASFTMPGKAVTVIANWNYNGSGGSGSSGSSGGSSGGSNSGGSDDLGGTTIITTPGKRPDQPISVVIGITVKVGENGIASAVISDKAITDAIANGQSSAKAQAKTQFSMGLNVSMPRGATSLMVVLTQSSLQSLVNAGVTSLEINGSPVTVSFDKKSLAEIRKQSSGDVTITIKPARNLSVAAKKLIGPRPVYDITVSYVKNGKSLVISAFNGGIATIAIPYKPDENEATGYLYGVYVDAKGNAARIEGSAYDTNTGAILISTDHLSVYGIGYTDPSAMFTDIDDHWGKESIDYVVGRGLLSGTSETTFAPNTAMTRGMLVTALGRLEGVDTKIYTTNSFIDVKTDSAFLPYIEWAYKNGVVQGIGNRQFASDRAITREEIAVIFANYAKATSYKLPVIREASTYEDASSMDSVYKTAVTAMQQAGIMMGDTNNKFNPKVSATRAEVSSMLHRYIKLTIDPDTAQGWSNNDAGQWFYYKDSKAFTGEQTINDTKYFFDTNGVLKIGWVKDGDNWHFYSGNKLLIGWCNIGIDTAKQTYYFDVYGNMVYGNWLQINGKWYYFNTNGSLARNTTVDGYEVDSDGIRKNK